MAKEIQSSIKGDRALKDDEPDRLGFSDVAKHITQALIDHASDSGMVIGLDGKWGSGKSSLLHLIEKQFTHLPEEQRPTLIHFKPWLVGSRDALLTSMFSELAVAVSNVQLARGDATKDTIQKAKHIADRLRKFADALSKAGDILQALETVNPLFGTIGSGLSKLKKILGQPLPPNLNELKKNITKDLKELNHRIIITVDDVDRLEPTELLEMLRLVRAVADFPNITYILCYDADIVSESIQIGSKTSDGAIFLEKIVQLTVMVPIPEPFQLREWFAQELNSIILQLPDEITRRLKSVIDVEGGVQLRTPRAVVRTLDSLRFLWPALRDEGIDAADLVWLELIKVGSPKLYRWIESYLSEISATSFGTSVVTDTASAKHLKVLMNSVSEGYFDDIYYRRNFAAQLPGIMSSPQKNGVSLQIYGTISDKETSSAIAGKRLSSPDHYSLYFGLSNPSYAINSLAMSQFLKSSQVSPEEAASKILEFHNSFSSNSVRKSDVLFERIGNKNVEILDSQVSKNIILSFGLVMDNIHHDEYSFVRTARDRAKKALPCLLQNLNENQRFAVVEELFSKSPSIGFLTLILRDETFDHGMYGDSAKPEEDWILKDEELQHVLSIMISRYRLLTVEDFKILPSRLQVFYAWEQAGDKNGPKEFFENLIITDQGFLDALSLLVSYVTNSDIGRYPILKRETLNEFLNFEIVQNRLKQIILGYPNTSIANQAKEFDGYIIDGKNFR